MRNFSYRRFLSLATGLLVAALGLLCVTAPANAALSTGDRQAYFESGKYQEDLDVVSVRGRKWIIEAAAKAKPRLKACRKAGFKIGITDPGTDPDADFTVPVTPPPNQVPKKPIYDGPDPGPPVAGASARTKKPAKGKKHLPKVTRSQCAKTKKLAIAMDMDETATSTYRFGSDTPEYDSALAATNLAVGTQTAIAPMLKTYRLARRLGVAVFVITARPDSPSLREVTEANLQSVGYTDLQGVYMKPVPAIIAGTDTGEVKNAERAEIVRKRGFRMLAMFGDQDTDLVQGFYERGFKFPNVY